MTIAFAASWDYRCPFARNAHEHVVTALQAGADWDVTFVPFSLNQVHVEEGGPDVWDDATKAPALLAMQVGIVVRDRFPERFLDVHRALFAARHDEGGDIRERDVLARVLTANGLDAGAVFAEIEDGWPLETFRKEHEQAAGAHGMWGVPTFAKDGQAVFVRLMHRPHGDAEVARATIERVVDLVGGWPDLNEFKHTSIPR
jgi:protein-disulfide isomerase-like protein with CxxC motif